VAPNVREAERPLVGHWETDKTNTAKASLDLEFDVWRTAVLENFHMVENGKPVEMTTFITSMATR